MIKVYWHSSEQMDEVDDNSVKLVLTSPGWPDPKYGISKEYLDNYYSSIKKILENCYKKLRDDGYLVLQVTDNYREGTLLMRHINFCQIIKSIGYNIFTIKIWSRGDFVELYVPSFSYLIFASKAKRKKLEDIKRMHQKPFGYDVWKITEEYKWFKKYGAFPSELARRVILCFTEEGDIVLDPFLGTGTTVIVADNLNRIGIGYEINLELKEVFELRKKSIGGSLEKWCTSQL
jgi:DNA modification methylase